MSTATPSLPVALADVRRAYRLVQAYQRRVCDLFQLVDQELTEKHGLTFSRWDPLHANPPVQRTKSFFKPKLWAWDLLPGYQVQCQWTATSKERTRRVAIAAVADTGFDDTGTDEPDPGKFEDAEACGTNLWIGLWTAKTSNPDWVAAVKKLDRIKDAYDTNPHQMKVDGRAYVYQYRDVSIADLVDEAAVQAKLLGPIQHWLGEKA